MTAELTYDQWLEAYGAAHQGADDAYTTVEWADKYNSTPRIVTRWIDIGLKNGWLVLTWVRRADRTGIVRTRPAYRLTGRKESPPRKGKKNG